MTEKLVLGAPFSHHMVLQRGRSNRIWGWDRPGQTIEITLVGPDQSFSEVVRAAETNGAFSCVLPALAGGGPYTLSVVGTERRTLEDVLIGEVWLACGQSNMEWTLGQVAEVDRFIAAATNERVRCLRMPRVPGSEPQATRDAHWVRITPDSASGVSAVAYHFARELERELDVAVGIIDSAYGGTRVEAWMSRDALSPVLDLDRELRRYYLPEAEHARLAADYAARILSWESEALPHDPGNRGVALGYANVDFDDQALRTLHVPSSWQAAGMCFNGVVWFRREIELPAAWAGRDLVLSLGAIDDFDHSYVNGELVGAHPKGTPGAYQIQRRYRVPGRLVRAGRNVIAVRVFDHFGEGGLLGPGQSLYVECEPGGERISLVGHWKVVVEHEIPLVPGSVWATYPPPPEPLNPQNAPAALYNGMIAPLLPFGIAGTLFYQGESNVDQHASYARRFRALVRDFRTRFGQGQLPFLFVQLAAFQDSANWPLLREAQAEVLSEPETGMVCTLDVGARYDIHPSRKREVGLRLARLALAQHYGRADVVGTGPTLSRLSIDGSECRVHFSSAEGLHTTDGKPPLGFEVRGADAGFFPADARIVGTAVVLTCEHVREPVAVRYAFRDYLDVNLVNAAGLPAFPFRTDGD